MEQSQGSTRSIDNVKSHLRCHCRLQGWEWIDEAAKARVALVEKSLKYDDYGTGNRKRPLLMHMLSTMILRFNLASTLLLQLAATLLIAHDGLLRGGEVWSGLKVADLLWHSDGKGFGLQLGRTKTHREGGPVTVTIRTKDKLALSGVNMVRLWFERKELWGQQERILFPGFNKVKGVIVEDERERGSKEMWIEYMREQLNKMGWDEREYAGHSLRAGGATDLFNSSIPLASIMKIGRWESVEAAMVYFRDDLVIAQAAAEAFGTNGK